jgi:UPF0716 protein FxsA
MERMPGPVLGFLVALLLLAAAELTILVRVAGLIGVLPTLLLLAAVGLLGVRLIRHQGLGTLLRAQAALQAGQPPVRELFDGACILASGVLLVLPGFLSDILACVLLLPPVRRLLYNALARRARVTTGPRHGERGPRPGGRPTAVIEGQYEEIEPVPDRRDERRGEP